MNETTQPDFVLLAHGLARHTLMPDIQRWLRDKELDPANIQIEPSDEQIYVRVAFAGDSALNTLRAGFAAIAREHSLSWWTIRDIRPKRRLVLMVSTQDHCVAELLARWRHHTLATGVDVEIQAVISNHPDVADLVSSYKLPFRYLPVGEDKAGAEAELQGILAVYQPDLLVLARYQQILSKQLCERYPGKIVNVHPSLLPAFPGANAYRQAADAGAKVVGATAHFVTAELDKGPIIGQHARSVEHVPAPDAKAYARVGRPAEIAALTEAVRLFCEDKLIVDGSRVVTFE